MKNRKHVFSMLCLVFILYLTLASAHAEITTAIKSASEYDYPPFSIVTKDGKADGFSVELLRAALRAVHLDVEFKVGPWAEIKNELSEGQIQVLPLVAREPERESIYDFTFTYLTLHGAIFVREGDTRIESVDDLADKEIIVMAGDSAAEYVERERISPHVIAVESYEGAMRLLASGKRDAVIAQRLMGIKLLKDIGISGIVPLEHKLEKFKQEFSFAVREGDKELLALLNEGLSIVVADGTFDRLHDKWFTPILGHRILPKDMIKYLIIFAGPAITIALILFVFILRREIRRKTIGLKQEIEEHKEAEEELKFRSEITDQVNASVIATGLDFKINWVNQAFNTLYGYSSDEVISQTPDFLNADPFSEEIQKDIYQTMSSGEIWTGEALNKRKDGTTFQCLIDIFPLKDENGNIFAYAGSQRDITERKKAEDQIKASLKEKEVLLQEIHHRVKNNFTVIMSLLSLQSANINDEGVKAIFRDSTNRLKSMSLVHDMLYRSEDLAHIDFGEYIRQLTQYTFRTYKVTSDKIRLNIDITDIHLNTDTSILIGMIVNELVSNAMEHAFPVDRRGEIWVAMKKIDFDNGHEYEIIVKDNGVGLPEGLDIHKTDTLGLKMVTNMVERQLSGSIEVKTDGGTEHKLRFKELVYKERI